MPRPRYSPARRELLVMMGLILVVHSLGIGIHRLADIAHRPRNVRMAYLAGWLVVTVLVVGIGLHRIRVARTRR